MTLIGFNPWFNTPKIRDSGEINLINSTNSTSDGFSPGINYENYINSTFYLPNESCDSESGIIQDSEYTTISVVVSIICFTTSGFASGGYITASYAIILDTFPETFSREIGFYEIFSGLAGGLAPLLAGAVLEYDNNFIYIGIMGGAIGFIQGWASDKIYGLILI